MNAALRSKCSHATKKPTGVRGVCIPQCRPRHAHARSTFHRQPVVKVQSSLAMAFESLPAEALVAGSVAIGSLLSQIQEVDPGMREYFLETVVPGLGAIVSLVMYSVPLGAVLQASSRKSLRDLNPIPFSITVANCIIMLLYGLLKHDVFITAPTAPGIGVAVFCTMTAYGIADEKVKSQLRNILCGMAIVLPLLGVLTVFACNNSTEQSSLWGLSGNIISLVYYGAPLSTMGDVIRTRNSASILLPLTFMNLLNALLWTSYGVAMLDPFLSIQNGAGVLLSAAQLGLAAMFPAPLALPEDRLKE